MGLVQRSRHKALRRGSARWWVGAPPRQQDRILEREWGGHRLDVGAACACGAPIGGPGLVFAHAWRDHLSQAMTASHERTRRAPEGGGWHGR